MAQSPVRFRCFPCRRLMPSFHPALCPMRFATFLIGANLASERTALWGVHKQASAAALFGDYRGHSYIPPAQSQTAGAFTMPRSLARQILLLSHGPSSSCCYWFSHHGRTTVGLYCFAVETGLAVKVLLFRQADENTAGNLCGHHADSFHA